MLKKYWRSMIGVGRAPILLKVLAPALVVAVAVAPRDVMHRARALHPGGLRRLLAGVARLPPAPLQQVGPRRSHGKAESLSQ